MAFKEDFNLFVGAKYGIFKAFKITSGQPTINKSIQSLQHLSKNADVTTMAWGDEDEEEILLGLSNQVVKVYDTNYKAFSSSSDVHFSSAKDIESEGSICGLFRNDGVLVTAVESGHIRSWRFENDKAVEIHAGGPLSRMKPSVLNPSIIGTGGLENELKLWDLTSGENIFTAKNVSHDYCLQLRVKVWVSDLSFLPGSDKVVIGSRYGYVRLYDPKAQRKPVINVDLPGHAVSCLTTCAREQTVLCGLAKGNIQAVDLRMGRPAEKYSGFLGAVRDIACHPTEPYVVSASLDRFLRVHHLFTKELLFKEYVVSRVNCLLIRSNFTLKASANEVKKNMPKSLETTSEDFDDAFEAMEEIIDDGRRSMNKKHNTESKMAPPSKKIKTSPFVNPFASANDAPNQAPECPRVSTQRVVDSEDSDDDIQILSQTVGPSSSDSDSIADEAEGSCDDLSSDDSDSISGSSRTDQEDKTGKLTKLFCQKRKLSLSNPFYKNKDISS